MGFSHVLPSNAALKTFPNNSASSYSIPLQQPYNLKGSWEVGLRNVIYSGCVNTFHDDVIKVGRMYSTPEMYQKLDKPLVFKLPPKKTTKDIVKEINALLKGYMKLTLDHRDEYCTWKIVNKKFCVGISEDLRKRFKLFGDVITAYDVGQNNYEAFSADDHTKLSDLGDKENLFLVLLPLKCKNTKWIVKAANENITIETLLQRFNERVKGLELKYVKEMNKFIVYKTCKSDASEDCYETLHLLSPALLLALTLRRGGLFRGNTHAKYLEHHLAHNFKEEWSVSEYVLNEASDVSGYVDTVIPLKSQAFGNHKSAIEYLNTLHDTFEFTMNNETRRLTLEIKDDVRISFSNILRDCLAFDENDYTGKGKFTATGEFSLTRRIQHLYIYSNLGKYVRIGDTEAPLLGIVPFASDDCEILREKVFDEPIFVPLRSNYVSQIDIIICDGAGEVIPFVTSARTSLCIYLREV